MLFSYFEPTTYNVLKRTLSKIRTSIYYLEPTTYNVLKPQNQTILTMLQHN